MNNHHLFSSSNQNLSASNGAPFKNPKLGRRTFGDVDGGREGDRFSDLPEPIIHYIFSFLETIDVIRACTVSRKWRYLWVKMPYLNFDFQTVWSRPVLRWPAREVHEKFKDFVNWVLMLQDWSVDIQRFRLCCFSSEDDYTLHRWIHVAGIRNVRELELNVESLRPVELPHCLFTCESLVNLKLELVNTCALKLPALAGLRRVKSLELRWVRFTDSNFLRNFVSNCPLLENLSMQSCFFRDFKVLDICSASLKSLTVDISGFDVDTLRDCVVKVACPRLVSFYLAGSEAWDLSLGDPNLLQNVVIWLARGPRGNVAVEEIRNVMSKILKGIRKVEVLKLSPQFLEFFHLAGDKPECFSASLLSLKSLTLVVTMAENNPHSTINLLNLSPNLEVLTISFERKEREDEWKIPDTAISCLTYRLKTIKLYDFAGNVNELELVRFLLKNGHVLQNMSITWFHDVEYPSKIISKVMEFPKASRNVVLTFFEPTSESVDVLKL